MRSEDFFGGLIAFCAFLCILGAAYGLRRHFRSSDVGAGANMPDVYTAEIEAVHLRGQGGAPDVVSTYVIKIEYRYSCATCESVADLTPEEYKRLQGRPPNCYLCRGVLGKPKPMIYFGLIARPVLASVDELTPDDEEEAGGQP